MWVLLVLVAAAAAVLSFAALRDLALLCGFAPGLAWLLPVVVDAGAGAGCLIWLGEHNDGQPFARSLTWLLLASSVGGNAVVHGLTAYGLRPVWWLVVLVSAMAPAVLGAVVHLAVLVGRPSAEVQSAAPGGELAAELSASDGATELLAGLGRRKLARELDITEHEARKILAVRNGAAQ